MGNVLVNDECLTNIANAIRGKCSTTCGYKPGEMAAAIESISQEAGDIIYNQDEIAKSLINKTITSYANEDLTTVGAYAFYVCNSLTNINLPSAIHINDYAFSGCYDLESVSLPLVTDIGKYAFGSCSSLESINLPSATDIGENAFSMCSGLTSISLPLATTIGMSAFYSCKKLTSIKLPSATNIYSQAFGSCDKLTSVELDAATDILMWAFSYCSALTTVIIRSESMCSAGIDIFNNTPIASGTGYIYVPSNLVDTYKADTNWATYANQIRAIEDYPDITGG